MEKFATFKLAMSRPRSTRMRITVSVTCYLQLDPITVQIIVSYQHIFVVYTILLVWTT